MRDAEGELLIGIFAGEEALLKAASGARQKGLSIHDAYTPYAVHGLSEAMGLRPTRLRWVCFLLGLAGCLLALGFQAWTFLSSWQLNVGGKSFLALPALIPVTFEVTILFAAIGTVLVFFLRSRLLFGKKPARIIDGTSDDKFALALYADEGCEEYLKECGAMEVRRGRQ